MGEFSNPDQTLQFYSDYLMYTMENEGEEDQTITIYDYLGNQAVTCSGAAELMDDLVIFGNPGELCTEVGLMKKDGTILIEQDPGMIKEVDSSNDRYLKVYYAEAVTEDESSAIFYWTNDTISFSPSDGDTLYSGYITIFDLKKEQFVPNIRLTSPSDSVDACGETLLVRTSDGRKIYDSEGNVRLEDASGISIYGNFYVTSDGENQVVYSGSMERLFTTDKYIFSGILDEALVYKEGDGDNSKGLMDTQGNLITDPIYYSFDKLSEGYYKVELKDGDDYLSGVMRSDGTLLTEICYDYIEKTTMSGYVSLRTEGTDGNSYTLMGPEGIVAEGLNKLDTSSLLIEDPENDGKYLCLADGTYSLELYDPEGLTKGLVSAQNADMTYGVYDLMTGEELTGEEYLNIQMAYGCIYCYKDGTYTVYEISR